MIRARAIVAVIMHTSLPQWHLRKPPSSPRTRGSIFNLRDFGWTPATDTENPTGLLQELTVYPAGGASVYNDTEMNAVVVPMHLITQSGTLNLINATTVFGTPVDVTLCEPAIEAFFPADAATAAVLRDIAASIQ